METPTAVVERLCFALVNGLGTLVWSCMWLFIPGDVPSHWSIFIPVPREFDYYSFTVINQSYNNASL